MLTGWEFYQVYRPIDLHFNTEKYDIFKYNAKVNVNKEKFQERTDRFRFELLAGKFHNKNNAGHFCIANIVYGSKLWIYQPYADSDLVFLKWRKIRESMTHTFNEDMHRLKQLMIKHKLSVKSLFINTESGNHPPILQMLSANVVTAESCVILNNEQFDFLSMWKSSLVLDPFIEDRTQLLQKYSPFCKYDSSKVNTIFKEVVENV